MFCLSCKYTPQSTIKECIDSIQKFHPNEKIVICDSNSEDTSYFDIFLEYNNVEIISGYDSRIVGALKLTYQKYPDEKYYILTQDSIILKQDINEYIDSDSLFTSFLYITELWNTFYYFPEYRWKKDTDYMRSVLSKTDYKIPQDGQQINGCCCISFIIKNEMMKRFESKRLIDNLSAKNKDEMECWERIIGICAEQEGYSPLNYNMQGFYKNQDNDIFNKINLGRQ